MDDTKLENNIQLVFITDEWGYTKGGINTINMKLCTSIAHYNSDVVTVFCIVLSIEENAFPKNVTIISLDNNLADKRIYCPNDKYIIYDKLQNSSLFSTNNKTWIVGHDIITGQMAFTLSKFFAEEKKMKYCKNAIIHHMIYEDYMGQKKSYEGEKILDQIDLLSKADVLFGVGPRLRQSASDIMQKECPEIIPGIDMTDMLPSEYMKKDPFRITVCGRIGPEDDIIKNALLSVKSWAAAVKEDQRLSSSSKIYLIGCPESELNCINDFVSKYAGRRMPANPIDYLPHHKLLKQLNNSCKVCIMPSLSEGFGLTGWEAISLGVPVIISKRSGLYEFLSRNTEYKAHITVVDIRGGEENEEMDIRDMKEAIKTVYNDYKGHKNSALVLREKLRGKYTWKEAALNFIKDLEIEVSSKKKVFDKNITYFFSDVFTDRNEIIDNLFHKIQDGVQIINLYGRKGIGKTSILSFFYDGINNTISSINEGNRSYFKDYENIIKDANVNYIEMQSHNSICDAIKVKFSLSGDVLTESSLHQYIDNDYVNIIIFDNVRDAHSHELFDLYKSLIDFKIKRFCIIIGSVNELRFSELAISLHHSLYITPFSKADILSYAKNNKINYNDEDFINEIEKLSGGLPLYIKLLIKQSNSKRSVNYYEDMDKYISDVLTIIKKSSQDHYLIVIYLALFSITEESNHGVSVAKIQKHLQINNIGKIITSLENDYSFIEHNQSSRKIKIHDIIRDFAIDYVSRSDEKIIRNILESIESSNPRNRCFYILLLAQKYATDDNENNEVILTIKKAIKEERYLFLINIGELFLRTNSDSALNVSHLDDLYSHLLLGVIEGYIGVGDYPSAKKIVNTINLSIRESKADIEFQIYLAIAKLCHLQNDYQMAISTYLIIENLASRKKEHIKYQITSLWGIAHSYRHEGADYISALNYYNEAINIANNYTIGSDWFKCQLEKITTLDCLNRFGETEVIFDEIKKNLNTNPIDKYPGMRIAFKKVEARHQRIAHKDYSISVLNKLNEVLDDYAKLKKRLQYNTLFDIGEYYRKNKKNSIAFDYYQESLFFSIKNKDMNLNTMSMIAMILCEICAKNRFREDDVQHKSILIDLIMKCEKYNLHSNKLLAQLLLDYTNKVNNDISLQGDFKNIGFVNESKICNNINSDSLNNLNLTLM